MENLSINKALEWINSIGKSVTGFSLKISKDEKITAPSIPDFTRNWSGEGSASLKKTIIEGTDLITDQGNDRFLNDPKNVILELAQVRSTAVGSCRGTDYLGVETFVQNKYGPRKSESLCDIFNKLEPLSPNEAKSEIDSMLSEIDCTNLSDLVKYEYRVYLLTMMYSYLTVAYFGGKKMPDNSLINAIRSNLVSVLGIAIN